MREIFIKELLQQPTHNFGNKGTKVNIHFPLRGQISNYCIQLNREIKGLTKTSIDFSPKSFQIPHLTLYMGFVTNEQNYNSLLDEVYNIAQEMIPVEIIPKRPYIDGPKNNYILIDTEQSNQIIDIKKTMKEKLSKWIEPLSWDIVSAIPHITVAIIEDNVEDVKTLLYNYPLGPYWFGDSIEISYVGCWGSCLGSIRTFEFL